MDPIVEKNGFHARGTETGGNGSNERSSRVLVVDDEIAIRNGLAFLLRKMGLCTLEARHGAEAIRMVLAEKPDLVLLDLMMPELNGLDVCRQIKNNEDTRLIPVVMITAMSDPDAKIAAIEAGVDDFLNKPVHLPELKARVRSLLRVKHLNDMLERADKVIAALANAIEAKDKYTEGHNERVSLYSEALARAAGLDERDLAVIRMAGILHDIGKIGVPDKVLNKEGPLDSGERERVFGHPVYGEKILKPLRSLEDVSLVVLCHHERYDGAGYPNGLKGEEIPLLARIVSIADSYDAMTSTRSYRKALSSREALDELRRNAGLMWDPSLVLEFIRLVEQGGLEEPDSREEPTDD